MGTARMGRNRSLSDSDVACRQWCQAVITVVVVTLLAVGLPVWLYQAEKEFHEMYEATLETRDSIVELDAQSATAPGGVSVAHLSTDDVRVEGGGVADDEFGVRVEGGARLARETEYCQWQQTSVESCDTCEERGQNQERRTYKCNCRVQYYYTKGWHSYRINSFTFDQPANHHNPQRDPFPSRMMSAPSVNLGKYTVSGALISSMKGHMRSLKWSYDAMPEPPSFFGRIWQRFGYMDSSLYLDVKELQNFASSPAGRRNEFHYIGNGHFYSPYTPSTAGRLFKLFGQFLEGSLLDWQVGDLIPSCNAGDIRVSYRAVVPKTLSVVGEVHPGTSMNTIVHHKTTRGYQFGFLHEGIKDVEQIIAEEINDRKFHLKIARCVMLGWSAFISSLAARMMGFRWQTWLMYIASCLSLAGCITGLTWLVVWGGPFGIGEGYGGRTWAFTSALLLAVSLLMLGWITREVRKLETVARDTGPNSAERSQSTSEFLGFRRDMFDAGRAANSANRKASKAM